MTLEIGCLNLSYLPLQVAPIEEIKNNVSRFEGAVIRVSLTPLFPMRVLAIPSQSRSELGISQFSPQKKKLMRNQTLWAVLDRGVLSFFRSRADASTGTNRKTFRYLEKAIVVVSCTNSQIISEASRNS